MSLIFYPSGSRPALLQAQWRGQCWAHCPAWNSHQEDQVKADKARGVVGQHDVPSPAAAAAASSPEPRPEPHLVVTLRDLPVCVSYNLPTHHSRLPAPGLPPGRLRGPAHSRPSSRLRGEPGRTGPSLPLAPPRRPLHRPHGHANRRFTAAQLRVPTHGRRAAAAAAHVPQRTSRFPLPELLRGLALEPRALLAAVLFQHSEQPVHSSSKTPGATRLLLPVSGDPQGCCRGPVPLLDAAVRRMWRPGVAALVPVPLQLPTEPGGAGAVSGQAGEHSAPPGRTREQHGRVGEERRCHPGQGEGTEAGNRGNPGFGFVWLLINLSYRFSLLQAHKCLQLLALCKLLSMLKCQSLVQCVELFGRPSGGLLYHPLTRTPVCLSPLQDVMPSAQRNCQRYSLYWTAAILCHCISLHCVNSDESRRLKWKCGPGC